MRACTRTRACMHLSVTAACFLICHPALWPAASRSPAAPSSPAIPIHNKLSFLLEASRARLIRTCSRPPLPGRRGRRSGCGWPPTPADRPEVLGRGADDGRGGGGERVSDRGGIGLLGRRKPAAAASRPPPQRQVVPRGAPPQLLPLPAPPIIAIATLFLQEGETNNATAMSL
ncbi:hypothetical protein GW17_00019374 [Ensete ventricosum]|nr:hypothetical protein GW17_00019374 [Ensete ventricosum]